MNGTRVVAEGNVLFEHLMDKERLGHCWNTGMPTEFPWASARRERIIISTRRAWSAWTGFAGVFQAQFHGWMGIVGYAGEDIGLYRRSGRRQGAGSPFS